MGKPLSAIRTIVRQLLRDEFVSGSDNDFSDDELDIHINQCLDEVSQVAPNIVKEVLTTTANSRELVISDITNLLGIQRLEYPTGQHPRAYRNYKEIDQDTIEIDVDSLPTGGGSGTLTGTVTFSNGSTAITGSGTKFSDELAAGYHIKKSTGTRWYRIYSIESDTALTLAEVSRDDGADSAGATQYCYETVYLFCEKLHTLTEISSTLNADHERALVQGVAAYAALAWVNEIRKRLTGAAGLLDAIHSAIGDMSARITQAINDLTSGRSYIATKQSDAITAIDGVTTIITTALSDLSTGRALIGDKRSDAVTALGNISTRITQAVNDLTTGRAQIDDERNTANTAIDNVSARVTQALTDIGNARNYINKINIGGSPQTDYGNTAARELQTADQYLQQASGYLGLAASSLKYSDYAARDLQVANTYINEANAYLALDRVTDEHSNYAARQLQVAGEKLAQARGYIELSRPATEYSNYAARELSIATAALNMAEGYLREQTGHLNIARAITGYQNWANGQLSLYQQELKKITRPKVSQIYPKD